MKGAWGAMLAIAIVVATSIVMMDQRGDVGAQEGTPYPFRVGVRNANVILADSIPVCTLTYPNATKRAILIWNTALQEAGAVASDHDIFTFPTISDGTSDWMKCPIMVETKIGNVEVLKETQPGRECPIVRIGQLHACTKLDESHHSASLIVDGDALPMADYYKGDARIYVREWDTIHDNPTNEEYRYLVGTLVHELGHVLGMAHYYCEEYPDLPDEFRIAQDSDSYPLVTAMASGKAASCAPMFRNGQPRIEPMDVDDFRLLYPRIQGAPVSVTHASCQLNVSASPTIGGTVTGSGSAACGKTRTNLRAIPSTSADYGFEGWSGGGCSGAFCRPIVGTLGGSAETVNVTGRFAQYCTISVKVGTGVGSVSMTPSDGRVKCGVGEVSYKATAGTGYCFSSWGATLGASGQQAGCLTSSTKRITPTGDFTFTANFTRQQCTVTGSASPAAGGTVSGGGTVNCGESVTLSVSQAVAQAARYRFTGWSGGGCSGTGGTCTVVTRGSEPSVPVTANFTRIQYVLTASTSPVAGGTITGGGTYNSGTTATVTTSPTAGYRFTGWSGDCTGTGACTVAMNGNRSVTANFTRIRYTLTTTASPVGGGSVTGGGAYDSGTTATVTVSPTAGYSFTGWSGDCTGTGACSVLMNGNKSVTANFARIQYVLTASVSPSAGGSITGGGTYNSGTTVTVTATPNAGYQFDSWSGDCTGTGTCSVVMNGNKSVTATFTAIPPPPRQCTLTASPSPSAGGTVSGGGIYTCGTTVTVTASPATGYQFSRWSGACTGTGACSVVVNANRSVTATFRRLQCALTASASPSGGGTVSGGGIYTCGTRVTVTASPSAGYQFSRWSGACTGTGTCSVLLNASRSVTATFTRQQCALTASASPSAGGTVSGGGAYTCGTRVTVTASPSAGYQFSRWSGACTGTGTCSVLLNANRSVIATFTRVQYTLSTSVSPAGGGTVRGGGVYNSGTRVTVTASRNTGYSFSRWSGACTGTGTCTVVMNGNKSVRAHFTRAAVYYRLTVTVVPAGAGTPYGSGRYRAGTRVTVSAFAKETYRFQSWSGPVTNQFSTGTIGTGIVTMDGNKTVTALFGLLGQSEEEEGATGADASPTPTATPSPSATATPSPSATATPSPSATATPSPSATATPSPSATATPTPTATATPSPSATATPSPSASATPTP